MSDLVDAAEIEQIVGAKRHPTDHIGRACAADQTVYVLHSAACRDSGIDLRLCPFSRALERGITATTPWAAWRDVQDVPVRLEIFRGFLVPNFGDRAALALEAGDE